MKAMGGRYINQKGVVKSAVELYTENVVNTALMFNWFGDPNPRHNSGRMPMLDFVSGIFLILGFGYSLYRFYKPFYFMIFAMLASLLQAGMFSIESPQAYRTIAIIPIVLIFIIVFIHKAWQYFIEQHGLKKQGVFIAALIVLLCYMGYENFDSYFNKQGNDPGAWAEFSADECDAGQYVKSLGNNYQAIVSSNFSESYTFIFMTYPLTNFMTFDQSEHMPIKTGFYKNYVYVLDASYLPILPFIQKMYPEGKLHEFKHKFNGSLLYFGYEVPYEAAKKYQSKTVSNGLTGYYYLDDYKKDLKDLNNHWKGILAFQPRTDPFIMFNWTVDPIYPKYGPFSIKWAGKIKIEKSGPYIFTTKSNDYSDVYIDSKIVLKNIGGNGSVSGADGTVNLNKGMHSIIVRYYESVQYSRMQLWWRTPGAEGPEVVPSEVLFPEKK